jgi:hypothetical protein
MRVGNRAVTVERVEDGDSIRPGDHRLAVNRERHSPAGEQPHGLAVPAHDKGLRQNKSFI